MSQALREAPADLVTLQAARAGAPAGREPAPGFEGWVRGCFVDGSEGGGPYPVRTILERTVVLQVAAGDRRLARLDAVLVDPGQIEWQARAAETPLGIKRWRGQVPRSKRDAARERSDRRAIASQASVARARAGISRRLPTPEINAGDVAGAEPKKVARPEGDPGHSPHEDLELLAAPAPMATTDGRPEVEPEVGSRQCERCGGALARHNRSGLCTPCQFVCPDCGGRKGPRSPRCQRCRSATAEVGPDAQPGSATASWIASALEQLPEELRDAVGRLVEALARQQEIESELARYRAAEERIRRVDRRLRSAIGVGAAGVVG
jgi:hypothetical protein